MANHNYSQYSNKKRNNGKSGGANGNGANSAKPVNNSAPKKPVSEIKMGVEHVEAPTANNLEPVEFKLTQESVNTVSLPKTVEGVVVNCAKLNVRTEPSSDADVIYVLDVMSEIKIDVSKSNDEWFKVCTASGVDGYCMRKFVDAHL